MRKEVRTNISVRAAAITRVSIAHQLHRVVESKSAHMGTSVTHRAAEGRKLMKETPVKAKTSKRVTIETSINAKTREQGRVKETSVRATASKRVKRDRRIKEPTSKWVGKNE